jgi:hypothetical protein
MVCDFLGQPSLGQPLLSRPIDRTLTSGNTADVTALDRPKQPVLRFRRSAVDRGYDALKHAEPTPVPPVWIDRKGCILPV